MSYTKLVDCENKDNFTVDDIVKKLVYQDTSDLNPDGTPKIKIRTK